MGRTGFVFHKKYLEHYTGDGHPERPERLEAIIKYLKDTDNYSKLKFIEPSPAEIEWVKTNHTLEYIREVEDACKYGKKYLHCSDTGISSYSYEIALLAVGGVLKAIDAVMNKEIDNAFCAVRPPGHHALKNRAMGFCLFNNVAIAARFLQKKYNLSKILIIDWDVHHGNGTQDAFYDESSVMYFSIHQFPFYPGTGSKSEKGRGEGEGYTVNIPLPAGCGDREYIEVFNKKLKDEALKFKPEFIIISAGFDPHRDDPLGGMNVTANGFAELTRIVKEIANKYCENRIVSVLEGGYSLKGLSESVDTHISVLLQ